MSEYSRRQFLHDSLLTAAAAITATGTAALFAAENTARAKGPNEKLRILVVGVNGRGRDHLDGYAHLNDDCDVVAICDADGDVGPDRCESFAKKHDVPKPKFYQDIRKALEDNSIDCVSIAMPNHWHALAAIWAMQAGKDVYVEKPVCHNISEGRRIIETARKYRKICQTGTQCRSYPANIKAVEFIRAGKIGEVNLARGLCYKPRESIGAKGTYQPPISVDYNLWCGPAPLDPLTRPKLHYDWHWVWATGNGDLGNQGIHQMDVARWGLGVDSLPDGVLTYGGRFGYEDAGETPNTEIVVLDYGPKTLVFEVRGLPSDKLKGTGVPQGNIFEGTDGYVAMTNYNAGAAFDKNGKWIKSFGGSADHFANFLKAVRSRRKEDLTADIQEGFLSSSLCHLGNISYRLGQRISSSEILDRLKAVQMADNSQDTLNRTISHLAENKIVLEGDTLFQCGEYLKFDVAAETFLGNDKAHQMLTRDYRTPFVVPSSEQI